MSIELKIKSKHLATEPAIIRHEERKLRKQLQWFKQHYQLGLEPMSDPEYYSLWQKNYSLASHRKWDVRNETRATLLARAFLSGKPYNTVEKKVHSHAILRAYIVPRVIDMVMKYGPEYILKQFDRESRRPVWPKDKYEKYEKMVLAWFGIPF